MKRLMSKSQVLAFSCCFSALVLLTASAFGASGNRVLFVASNALDMGDPEQHEARNNLWEYAPPFHIFVMHGYEVDFVSPQGGAVEFMMEPLGISSYAIKYEDFLGKAGRTLMPLQVVSTEKWIYLTASSLSTCTRTLGVFWRLSWMDTSTASSGYPLGCRQRHGGANSF